MSFAQNTPIQFIPGIGWRTAEVMHDLGIHTVGQLYRIPENILIELFGPSIRSVVELVTVREEHLSLRTWHSAADEPFRPQARRQPMRSPQRLMSLTKRIRIATRMMALL